MRLYLCAAALGVAFLAGWSVNGWRLDEQIAQIKRDHAIASEAASETARLKERAWTIQAEGARNDAIQREAKIRRAAAGARSAADSVRNELADLRRRIPKLTEQAVRERADTLAELFGACTAEYRDMAEAADRHASDAQTLSEAWPK
jgi:hypothetical protein